MDVLGENHNKVLNEARTRPRLPKKYRKSLTKKCSMPAVGDVLRDPVACLLYKLLTLSLDKISKVEITRWFYCCI